MTMNPSLTMEVAKWAAAQGPILNPKDGYYSFGVLADAFDKGRDHKEKEIRELYHKAYMDRMTAFTQSIVQLLGLLIDKGYTAKEVYIGGDFDMPKAIVSIPPEERITDKFIDDIYGWVSDTEREIHKTKKITVDISFIDHGDNINRQLLKDDGFGLQIDLQTGQPLL